jgi:acyl-CoA synthetase (AMP-forming)/AMP-acid ligase II
VVVQYAAARVGAILVTIDPAYLLGNLAAMTRGACIVVPGESFAAADVLRAVEAERCTSLYGVPTMFIDALAHTDLFDLSSLRKFVDAFPTTVTGKPQKYRMREIAVRELGLAS